MKKSILICLIIASAFSAFSQTKNDSLYSAVSINDQPLVIALIKDGADVNYVKSAGPWVKTNCLLTAVEKGNIDMIRILIEGKVNVNWKDGFNTSAIMYAAKKGAKDIVVLLLDNGANIKDEDGKGNSVITAAKESKNKDLVKFVEGKLKEKEEE